MTIQSVTLIGNTFKVVEDGRIKYVPDDKDNVDRILVQEWIDGGNEVVTENSINLTDQSAQGINWNGLAMAFKTSSLNQLLKSLKDEGTNPEHNAIWRLSDELVQVITLSIFPDHQRIEGMNNDIVELFTKLKESGVVISESIKTEVVKALVDNNFKETASIVEGIEI